ncbi:MAG TPA: hypothetical protein VK826_06440 [Bacteroidia bacterium]|nr:hypothetical protein [Bacteroidia bacterium]
MANWKFTTQYGATYPGLASSILNVLVFDVPTGSSPVTGTTFTAPLDLAATGPVMNVLASLTGLSTIPMTGTVTTTGGSLTVTLTSSNNTVITAAIAKCIPLIGGSITQDAGISINNVTPAAAKAPTTDDIDLNVTITIGSKTATLVSQVPMSGGIFTLDVNLVGFGVNLSDLNFLVTGTPFSSLFPNTLPTSWYTSGSTSLNLLSLSLTLHATTAPAFSVQVSTVSVVIGIVNIPIYPNGIFLDPLAVWLTVTSPTNSPTVDWGLSATAMLYPYGRQTNPPTAPPDFTFDMDLQLPSSTDPTFSVSGSYDNPYNLPVATMLSDLMNSAGFNTGIGTQITLTKFDISSSANTATGSMTAFTVDIAMSSPVGIFANPNFGVKDFTISVDYSS